MQLWDSDKRTADDIVGRVNKSLKEIMSKPNELTSHKDGLMGFEDADTMSGSLHWSVGFFEKVSHSLPVSGVSMYRRGCCMIADCSL